MATGIGIDSSHFPHGKTRRHRASQPLGSCATISVERVQSPRRIEEMAYVIAEPCIGTKDTACVDACPVDCIHPKKDEDGHGEADQLFIDPVECIDCGACVPACPVSAIFARMTCRRSGLTLPRRTPRTSAANLIARALGNRRLQTRASCHGGMRVCLCAPMQQPAITSGAKDY